MHIKDEVPSSRGKLHHKASCHLPCGNDTAFFGQKVLFQASRVKFQNYSGKPSELSHAM